MKRKVNWVIVLAIVIFMLTTLTFGWKNKDDNIKFSADKRVEQDITKYVNEFTDNMGIRNLKNIDDLNNVAKYISNEFENYGLNVSMQNFKCNGKDVYNVIGKKNSDSSKPVIVICANYDSIIKEGVNAQNTGIAALLTIADEIKDKNLNYEIEFAAFVNLQKDENRKEFTGSSVYVNDLEKQNKNIKGIIFLDSLGRYSDENFTQRYAFNGVNNPNKGNYVAVIGNSGCKDFSNDLVKEMKSKSNFPVLQRNSDISLEKQKSEVMFFWEKEYPAVIITDTGIYRNDDINTKNDTKDKINFKYMAEVVNNLINAVSNIN